MKSRPILFSGPLIRALLNTKPDVWPAVPVDPALPFKSQTRRVAKFKPREPGNFAATSLSAGHYFTGSPNSGWVLRSMGGSCWNDRTYPLHCPYGAPGDLLWVRECFYLDERNRKGKVPQEVIYAATPEWAMDYTGAIVRVRFITGEPVSHEEAKQSIETNQFWHKKPSIHMPRWASRLTLEVESVRVERLLGITEEDALAEGMRDGVAEFMDTWALLHGRDSLQADPWVWAITVKRLSQEVAQRRLAA